MDLKSVNLAAEAVERQRQFVEMLRYSLCDPPAPRLDGLPHAQQQRSRVESAVCKVEEAENDLRGLESNFCSIKRSVSSVSGKARRVINCVGLKSKLIWILLTNEIFRRVRRRAVAEILCRRYVRLEQFREIASAMCLSEPRVYTLHREGVKEYQSAPMTDESSVAMTCPA